MKKVRKIGQFQIYTVMWLVAILVLIALLWQNLGGARIINYSGIVRGATQKLVKEELHGYEDDALISRLTVSSMTCNGKRRLWSVKG